MIWFGFEFPGVEQRILVFHDAPTVQHLNGSGKILKLYQPRFVIEI